MADISSFFPPAASLDFEERLPLSWGCWASHGFDGPALGNDVAREERRRFCSNKSSTLLDLFMQPYEPRYIWIKPDVAISNCSPCFSPSFLSFFSSCRRKWRRRGWVSSWIGSELDFFTVRLNNVTNWWDECKWEI